MVGLSVLSLAQAPLNWLFKMATVSVMAVKIAA